MLQVSYDDIGGPGDEVHKLREMVERCSHPSRQPKAPEEHHSPCKKT